MGKEAASEWGQQWLLQNQVSSTLRCLDAHVEALNFETTNSGMQEMCTFFLRLNLTLHSAHW